MNRIGSFLCKIFLKQIIRKIFVEEVRGLENIPKGNFILASNHQSHLDIIIAGYLCVPRRFTFIGQVDRYRGFQSFFRNFFYSLGGVIPVNRKDTTSRKRAAEKAIKSVKKGDVLVIYPEGTRSRTGKLGEGRHGVAKIFLATGTPILPVGIKGTFELLPPGKSFPKIKRIVRISIGKPLPFQEEFENAKILDCNSAEYKSLLKKITERVMEEIKNLIA